MTLLNKLDKALASAETALLILFLTVMVVMAFLQVVLRNLFSTGILWGDSLLRHLVLWLTFFGASLATRESRHIKIDVLARLVKGKLLHLVTVLTNLTGAVVSGFLAKASLVFVLDERAAGTTAFANVPTWLLLSILVYGFAVIALRFLFSAINEALALRSGGIES
jgi:TRAP-type C4-dicarboxylate transport system permease small subunit